MDACRKDVAKRHAEIVATKHQQDQISQLKDMGTSGQMLMDSVCSKKEDLVHLFEQIFGKQRTKEQLPKSVMHMRARHQEGTETEACRKQRIMNDPIENLVMKTGTYLSD